MLVQDGVHDLCIALGNTSFLTWLLWLMLSRATQMGMNTAILKHKKDLNMGTAAGASFLQL